VTANPQTPKVPLGDGEHILFVDDEPSLIDCGQRILKRLGYRVTTVPSGTAALKLIQGGGETFDCILTDFTMPDMSGMALARECRSLAPATPIILMSGYCGVLSADTLKSQGIHELILKPFTPQTVAEALRRALAEAADGRPTN
jgi:DNA-binding NtrC family response regulator